MALTKNPAENQRCLDCGRGFHCAIATGTPCWCATEFPAHLPLPDTPAGCYCPECLGKRLAARQ